MRKWLIALVPTTALLVGLGVVIADDDRDDSPDEDEHYEYVDDSMHEVDDLLEESIEPVRNSTYLKACGDCHFAYQGGLLVAEDWMRILDTLDAHFGEDASLPAPVASEVNSYLLSSAADVPLSEESKAFSAGGTANDNTLPRITTSPYFLHEHDEIPERYVTGNPEVGTFGQCDACHVRADQGVYDEHDVVITGIGPWEDD